MKSYLEACGFPVQKVANRLMPSLILGHLPFIGESYQGPVKNREYALRFSNIENTVKILKTAVERYGLTVVAASASTDNDLTRLFFKAIKETIRMTNTEMALIPCFQIPLTIKGKPVDAYRRWLTYYEIEKGLVKEEIMERYLSDPILQCRSGWKARFKDVLQYSKPYEAGELEDLQVNYRILEEASSKLTDFNILFAELGSETDFLAMTGKLDVLSELVDWFKKKFGYSILLGVHHAGSTIPALDESRIEFEGYVTPVNSLGVMMFPTEEAALRAIREARRPVIAIKSLAGGRIQPAEALEYVYRKVGVKICMIGVGSEKEAEEDFSIALKILKEMKPF